VNNFPEKLRQVMHDKCFKAADVAKGTGINASVLSRYLSGANKPSSDNILAISHYLNVSPEWLLSSSEAPEPIKKSQVISSVTEPLLKTIEVQDKLIKNLEKQLANSEKEQDHTKTPRGYFVPKDTLKKLFSLIEQSGSYGAVGLGSDPYNDEMREYILSEMERLDKELKTIQSLYFSDAEIQDIQNASMKLIKHRPPTSSKRGRPPRK
jgi:transcriptional regulator with XRE-family HTH domain